MMENNSMQALEDEKLYEEIVPIRICPHCGSDCDTYYKRGATIVGCEECIKEESAYED